MTRRKYLVISDHVAPGSSVFQTREQVTGTCLHDVLTQLAASTVERNDHVFTMRIERLSWGEETE